MAGQTIIVGENQREICVLSRGPQGPIGASAGTFFTMVFNSPLLCWDIVHNFGRRPVVELTDLGGCGLWGSIVHSSANTLKITFLEPQTGIATLL